MNSKPAVAAERERPRTLLADAWARIRTSLFWMVAIALFLRVGWIIVGHTYKFKNTDDNFGFGWEMGRIAAAIASGHGFSNPFGAATGPTAWEPPLYPYLTAGVFHFFGIYSRASAFVLLSLNSVFSALTCIPIFLVARRIFSEKVAVGSAWTWALLPYAMYCARAGFGKPVSRPCYWPRSSGSRSPWKNATDSSRGFGSACFGASLQLTAQYCYRSCQPRDSGPGITASSATSRRWPE